MEYSDKLLGTLPDTDLAKLTGKSCSWIHRKRVSLSIPSYRSLFGCLPKFNYNINAFNNINCISAYWLGFYFADGCVCETTGNRYIVTICSLDREVVDKLKTFYGIEDHENTTTTIANNKNVYHLQLCNKKLFNKFCELGCVPRKSNILKAPIIDSKFYLPFILGYFDGDGCISRNSAINSWKISICTGSKDFFEWLESIIKGLDISYNIDIRRTKNLFYSIALCGISGKFFMNKLYEFVPEYLPLSRKKQKFNEMCSNKFVKGPNLFDWEKEYIIQNRDNYLCSELIKTDKRNYGWVRSPYTIQKIRKYHKLF